MKHFIYRTHNLINQKEYTGKHSTDDPNDGYYGSGPLICKVVKKYGLENFAVEILSFHETADLALNEEAKIVDEEYVDRADTYNQTLGGFGSWYHTKGKVPVKDKNGNNLQVSVNDPRYLSGELKHIACNLIVVKDKSGNTMSVSIDDPRYLSGELNATRKNTVSVKDKNGNNLQVSVNDPRYLSGELVGITKSKLVVKDMSGNMFQVDKDDPRYLSGELVHNTANMTVVKDKSGNTMQVSVDDPRYLSGELVGHTKGTYNVKDKNGNIFRASKDDIRIKSGELVGINKGKKLKPGPKITCPHCNKTGYAKGLKRWHFDNCKFNLL